MKKEDIKKKEKEKETENIADVLGLSYKNWSILQF